ncbi:MAG: hypothetical protein J7L11_02280 [Thermoprotei archaeon]|nr:hypothetical protein [Thermoprotei archaeon]
MPMGSNVEEVALRALIELIANTKGSCMTFTPKKVAIQAGLDTKPVTLTVVKYVLEKLRKEGLVKVWRSSRRMRYMVTKESPLWQEAKKLKVQAK